MTAQIWLWAVLSGLGIGIAGWWIRGWQASGRELVLKRQYEARLCAVEEDAKRVLQRARAEAANDRKRLEAAQFALRAHGADKDLLGATGLDRQPHSASGNGTPNPAVANPARPFRKRPPASSRSA